MIRVSLSMYVAVDCNYVLSGELIAAQGRESVVTRRRVAAHHFFLSTLIADCMWGITTSIAHTHKSVLGHTHHDGAPRPKLTERCDFELDA